MKHNKNTKRVASAANVVNASDRCSTAAAVAREVHSAGRAHAQQKNNSFNYSTKNCSFCNTQCAGGCSRQKNSDTQYRFNFMRDGGASETSFAFQYYQNAPSRNYFGAQNNAVYQGGAQQAFGAGSAFGSTQNSAQVQRPFGYSGAVAQTGVQQSQGSISRVQGSRNGNQADCNTGKCEMVDPFMVPDWSETFGKRTQVPQPLMQWPHQNEVSMNGTTQCRSTQQVTGRQASQNVSGVQNIRDYFDFANRPTTARPLARSPTTTASESRNATQWAHPMQSGGISSVGSTHGAHYAVPRVFSSGKMIGTKQTESERSSIEELNNVPRVFRKTRENRANGETKKAHDAHRQVISEINQMAGKCGSWQRIGNVTYGYANTATPKFEVNVKVQNKGVAAGGCRSTFVASGGTANARNRKLGLEGLGLKPMPEQTFEELFECGSFIFDRDGGRSVMEGFRRELMAKSAQRINNRDKYLKSMVSNGHGPTGTISGRAKSPTNEGYGLRGIKLKPIPDLTPFEVLESGMWLFNTDLAPDFLRKHLPAEKNMQCAREYMHAHRPMAARNVAKSGMQSQPAVSQHRQLGLYYLGLKPIRDLTAAEMWGSGLYVLDTTMMPQAIKDALVERARGSQRSQAKYQTSAAGANVFASTAMSKQQTDSIFSRYTVVPQPIDFSSVSRNFSTKSEAGSCSADRNGIRHGGLDRPYSAGIRSAVGGTSPSISGNTISMPMYNANPFASTYQTTQSNAQCGSATQQRVEQCYSAKAQPQQAREETARARSCSPGRRSRRHRRAHRRA